jgi:uncharacterized Ntn-hydrolase superfamily protein
VITRVGVLAAVASAAAWPTSAGATWSIVAVDPDAQQVGVAVASCVEDPLGDTILPEVVGLAPGIGAMAVQAQFHQSVRDAAVERLQAGFDAQAIIDMTNATDPLAATRQYGVVLLSGEVATYTGGAAQSWAGSVEGTLVSAQGNILYGPEVVDDALAAFEAPADCPFTLADRLMVALEAGAAQGGDNRCRAEQSALAATIKVAGPDDAPDAPMLDLRISSQPLGGDNPVALLRAEYDAWRAANPPDASGCDVGGSSSSSGGGGDDDTGAPSTTTGSSSAESSGGDGSSGATGSSSGAASDGGDGGCACTASRRASPGALGPLGLLGLLGLLGPLGVGARRRRPHPGAHPTCR